MQVIHLRKKQSKNALQGAIEANVPYIRYERESQRRFKMKKSLW